MLGHASYRACQLHANPMTIAQFPCSKLSARCRQCPLPCKSDVLLSSSLRSETRLSRRGGRVLARAEKDKRGKDQCCESKDVKKEHKKLADTLKATRKRLDKLTDFPVSAAEPTAALLQQVLAELQQVRQLLSTRMVEEGDSSSSSSSDSDEEYDMRMDWKQRAAMALTSPANTDSSLLVHTLHGDMEVPHSPRSSNGGSAIITNGTGPSIAPTGAPTPAARVVVCQGSKCSDRGAQDVLMAAVQAASGYGGTLEVAPCKCLGRCKEGPAMRVQAAGSLADPGSKGIRRAVQTRVEPSQVPDIIAEQLVTQREAMNLASRGPDLAVERAPIAAAMANPVA